MIALIGSQAANHHIPGFRDKPGDLDIVGTYEDIIKYKDYLEGVTAFYPIENGKKIFIQTFRKHIIEAEIAWPGTTAEKLLSLIKNDPKSLFLNKESNFWVASLDVLYMLKMSHRFLKNSPAFKKTMSDIIFLDVYYGVKIQEEHMEFFREREKETYTYSHPKLNQKKDTFFSDDGVQYVFDHDSIHESVRILEKPAYTYFKDDQSEVWCSKEKFFACEEHIRMYAVLEESLVLALERSQIPFPHIDPDKSFQMALEKVCTSITSGWFREYAYDNYDSVIMLYETYCSDYVSNFWKDVDSGIVKRLKQESV